MQKRELQNLIPGAVFLAICLVASFVLIPYLDIALASGIFGASLLALGIGTLKWSSRAEDFASELKHKCFRFAGYVYVTAGVLMIAWSATSVLFPDL